MNDIWTMIWKETKDSVLQGGLSALIRPLLLIGVVGIGFPWRFGLEWLALTPLVMGIVLYFPFILILSFVGDAIAGERERHTLETLLASRISDRAIVLGKIIVTTGYAWSTALLGLLLGLTSAWALLPLLTLPIAVALIRTVFSVDGRPLRASVYPARVILFRPDRATYFDDGHTQRLRPEGAMSALLLFELAVRFPARKDWRNEQVHRLPGDRPPRSAAPAGRPGRARLRRRRGG